MPPKTIICVGPTGSGKSKQVSRFVQEGAKPIVGHDLWSQTTETKGYNAKVGEEDVILFDTPGLGDSEARDQVFLDDFVKVLQENCRGVHKFYFLLAVTEPRFNAYLHTCFSLMLQLAPELKQKPSILTMMLTKADKGGENYWQRDLDTKVGELKATVTERFGMTVNVIIVGNDKQEQFVEDVKAAPMDVFCQTAFMKNVETLDTQRTKATQELEAQKKTNEQTQENFNKLQVELSNTNAENAEARKKLTEDIAGLQKSLQDDEEKKKTLQAALDKANNDHAGVQQQMQQEIANLQQQIAQIPQNNGGGGGGGGGCQLF